MMDLTGHHKVARIANHKEYADKYTGLFGAELFGTFYGEFAILYSTGLTSSAIGNTVYHTSGLVSSVAAVLNRRRTEKGGLLKALKTYRPSEIALDLFEVAFGTLAPMWGHGQLAASYHRGLSDRESYTADSLKAEIVEEANVTHSAIDHAIDEMKRPAETLET